MDGRGDMCEEELVFFGFSVRIRDGNINGVFLIYLCVFLA